MTRECLRAKPWLHVALLDYLPLAQRTQRHGTQADILAGLRQLGLGVRQATERAATNTEGNIVAGASGGRHECL